MACTMKLKKKKKKSDYMIIMVLSCLRSLRHLQVTVPIHNSVASLVHMHSVRLIALHFSPNNRENLVGSSMKSCFINNATYRYYAVAFKELS